MKIVVVGTGLSGAVLAERWGNSGATVTVYEKRDYIGGNCHDYTCAGHIVSAHGPHFFHTNIERVWEYIQPFAEWIPFTNRVKSRVGDKLVPVPVNIDTVNILFDTNLRSIEDMEAWLKSNQVVCENPANSEEVALSRVGPDLYNLLFKGYTQKQWGRSPAELGPSVLARIPVRNNWDTRYFTDKYQAIPKNGYTERIH